MRESFFKGIGKSIVLSLSLVVVYFYTLSNYNLSTNFYSLFLMIIRILYFIAFCAIFLSLLKVISKIKAGYFWYSVLGATVWLVILFSSVEYLVKQNILEDKVELEAIIQTNSKETNNVFTDSPQLYLNRKLSTE